MSALGFSSKCPSDTPSRLTRTLGVRQLVAYYVSSLLGVGVLATPLLTAEIAGPACLVAWGVLVLVSYPYAHVFAQVSIAHPHSGGLAGFVGRELGARIGHAAGLMLLSAMVVLTTVMGLVIAQHLQLVLDSANTIGALPLALVAIMASVLANLIGLRLGARIQGLALCALIAALIVIVILSAPHARAAHLTPFAPAGWTAVGSAAVICFFAFLGWENVATLAEEVHDPERTFRRAIRWATGIVGGLYIALAAITVLVIPRASGSEEQTVLSELLAGAAGEHAARIGNAIGIGVLLIAMNAWVLGCSRLVYALARDGVLPAKLARLTPQTATPCGGLLALAAASAAVAGLTSVAGIGIRELITFVNANFVVVYLVSFLAVLRHFRAVRTRRLAWTALCSTAAFLPFLGHTLLLTAGCAALALVATWAVERHGRTAPPPAPSRRQPTTRPAADPLAAVEI